MENKKQQALESLHNLMGKCHQDSKEYQTLIRIKDTIVSDKKRVKYIYDKESISYNPKN